MPDYRPAASLLLRLKSSYKVVALFDQSQGAPLKTGSSASGKPDPSKWESKLRPESGLSPSVQARKHLQVGHAFAGSHITRRAPRNRQRLAGKQFANLRPCVLAPGPRFIQPDVGLPVTQCRPAFAFALERKCQVRNAHRHTGARAALPADTRQSTRPDAPTHPGRCQGQRMPARIPGLSPLPADTAPRRAQTAADENGWFRGLMYPGA